MAGMLSNLGVSSLFGRRGSESKDPAAQSTRGVVGILMKDKQGEEASTYAGIVRRTIPQNILRGSLLVPIPVEKQTQRNDGTFSHNYQTILKDRTISLFCDSNDISPLNEYEYNLLCGIESLEERYQMFISPDVLDWATKLTAGDGVHVSIPFKHVAESVATKKVSAVIHYIGAVEGLPGITFGVEITDSHYFGQGSTNGVFQDKQYFTCREDNALFVSLDRLSERSDGPPIETATTAAAATAPPRTGGQRSAAQPPQRDGRRKKAALSEAEAELSVPPPSFNVGDRVVFFKKDATHVGGRVRWNGPYAHQDGKNWVAFNAVGIETDVKVFSTEMESFLPQKSHAFTVGKDKGQIFIREEEVMLEANFLGQDTPPETPPERPPKSPGQSGRAKQPRPPAPDPTTGNLDASNPTTLARQLGMGRTEFMKEQSMALQQAAEKKKKDELAALKQALPGESLNIQKQERALRKMSSDRRREEEKKMREEGRREEESKVEGERRREEERKRLERRDMEMRLEEEQRQRLQGEWTLQEQWRREEERKRVEEIEEQRRREEDELRQQEQLRREEQRKKWLERRGERMEVEGGRAQFAPPLPAQEPYQGYPPPSPSPFPPGPTGPPINQLPPHSNQLPPHPTPQHQAYAGHPGAGPPPNLGLGSFVQLAQDLSRTGVVRWIGELPEIQGVIAGVELDELMEGCGDGEWRGQRQFTCPPGHGFFCPVFNLRLDERFMSYRTATGGSRPGNPMEPESPEWEEEDQTIDHNQIEKYVGEKRGIQGHQNSCYLDATIFGLFALSDVLDSLFLDSAVKSTPTQIQREISHILWKGIVNPLRKNGAVRHESVMRLRMKLEELGKMEGVATAEKDPEEFLNMLFKHTLQVDPFIRIKRPFGTEPEFFIQLFVEFDESLKNPTVENLLQKMFREQQISFASAPSKLLVQVPRFGKHFKTYKRIIPGIKLDPSSLMESPNTCFICGSVAPNSCAECETSFKVQSAPVYFCDDCNEKAHSRKDRTKHKRERCAEACVEMQLLSVICIETSHYVCFTRDSEGHWVFSDSMANRLYDTYNIPCGTDCTAELREWVYEGSTDRLMAAGPRELPELVRRFTQDVYLCVYIQPDFGMYG